MDHTGWWILQLLLKLGQVFCWKGISALPDVYEILNLCLFRTYE